RGFALQPSLENRVHHHVRARIGADRTNFDSHTFVVADGYANHRAAIDGGRLQLVGSLEVRIEAAVGVHAGIQQQADIVAVGQNAVDEFPAELAELLFALGIPEEVFAILADGNVSVHAAAVAHDHWLG